METQWFFGRVGSALSAFAVATLVAASVPAADVTSTWNGTTGNWTDATQWSSNPWYPNNGNGGYTYDAVVGAGNTAVDQAIEINALTFSGGSLDGLVNLTVSDLTWTGGTIYRDLNVVLGSSANMHIGGGASKVFSRSGGTGGHGKILNEGQIVMDGTGSVQNVGGGSTYTYTTVHNKSTGLFDLQSDAGFTNSGLGTGTIQNEGVFRKSGGSGTSNIGWNFDNSGTVQVGSGTLAVGGSFNNTGTANVLAGKRLTLSGGGNSTGTFNVGSGGVLDFNGGAHNLGGVSISNAGAINFSGGTARFSSAVTVPGAVQFVGGAVQFDADSALTGTSTFSGGSLDGLVSLTVSDLTWTGGTIYRDLNVVVGSNANMHIGGAASKVFSRSGGTGGHGKILNEGQIVMDGTGSVQNVGGGSTYTYTTVHNKSAGLFDLQSDAGFTNSGLGTGTIQNEGVFQKSGGSGTSNIGWTFNNSGTVDVQSGTLSFGNFTQSAGSTDLNGGSLAFSSPAQILGGQLLGSGTITGSIVNSGGLLSPGHSAGSITINGNYTQGATGALLIELGGLASNQFDFLDINGTASLDGTLEVAFLNGFRPTLGDTFHIMDFNSRIGDFDSIHVLGTQGYEFAAQYSDTGLSLQAVPEPSTSAVFLIGATTVLLMTRRRRKQR